MSGHCPKITPESLKEVLEFDSNEWGAGLYGKEDTYTTSKYAYYFNENSSGGFYNRDCITQKQAPCLSEHILSLYQALKKASHFHPVIEILRRDAEVITKRLYGTIPKQEWQPETAEQKLACLIYRKDHGKNPTRKEMQKIIDDIKERKFEVK